MSYDYKEDKKDGKRKRVTKVYRPPKSTGQPSVAWLQGKETGFPTKSEFNALFSVKERMVATQSKYKGYSFAWAVNGPKEMLPWVIDQIKLVRHDKQLVAGIVTAVWCRLPAGPKGQDAVPAVDSVLQLVQDTPPEDRATQSKKVGDFTVLQSSTRLSTRQRGVCFLVLARIHG